MQIKTKIISSHTTDSRPVEQEVNGTKKLPPLVFPGKAFIVLARGVRRGWGDRAKGFSQAEVMTSIKLDFVVLTNVNSILSLSHRVNKNVYDLSYYKGTLAVKT